MTDFASPIEIAAVLVAVGWPFAAGLAVVLWSKSRAARQRKLAAIDAELRDMYREAESRPVPERLTMVIDALAEAEALNPKAAKTQKPARSGATRRARPGKTALSPG